MRLDGDSAFLEFERSDVGDGSDPDLLLNVTVSVGNYSAADQCWIAASDQRYTITVNAAPRVSIQYRLR